MATDLTVRLINRPGTLLQVSDALARAGINIDGACGQAVDDVGVCHVLVTETERARRALLDAGLEIEAERPVVLVPAENRPGGASAVLRGIAEAGVNIDLLYVAADGRLVLGGGDLPALRKALGLTGLTLEAQIAGPHPDHLRASAAGEHEDEQDSPIPSSGNGVWNDGEQPPDLLGAVAAGD
jgi:hypothetical protein